MTDLIVDPTTPQYILRRQQFTEIVQFWNPKLKLFFQLSNEDREAWREQDPFMDDIIRWHKKLAAKKHEEM